MKKALTISLIILSALTLSACDLLFPQSEESASTQNQSQQSNTGDVNNNSGQNQISGVKVSVTDNGFEPSSVTIGAGQTVTFTNNSSNPVFVASDPHPTHTNLPEFQSKNVAVGESYSFTFNQLGSWGYHNHLNPSVRGTVVVN